MPVRPEPVEGPRPNAALLFIIIFIVFHCYLRGRETPGKARKAARRKAKFAS
jgi:hypothetical protein